MHIRITACYFYFVNPVIWVPFLRKLWTEVHSNPENTRYIVTIFVKCQVYCFSQKEFIKRSMISVYGYDTHKSPHIVASATYRLQ